MKTDSVTLVIENNLISLMPKLKRYAVYLTKDQDRAADLVQEACARILSKRDTYNNEYGLEPWFKTIIKNLWIDQIRHSKRQVTIEGSLDEDTTKNPHDCSEKTLEHRSILRQIETAIYALTDNDQNVLEQVIIYGNSYQQTANELSLPLGTVMSRFSRAKGRLKQSLGITEEFHFALLPFVFQSDFNQQDAQVLEIEFNGEKRYYNYLKAYISDEQTTSETKQSSEHRSLQNLTYQSRITSPHSTEIYYSALIGTLVPSLAVADQFNNASIAHGETFITNKKDNDNFEIPSNLLEEQSDKDFAEDHINIYEIKFDEPEKCKLSLVTSNSAETVSYNDLLIDASEQSPGSTNNTPVHQANLDNDSNTGSLISKVNATDSGAENNVTTTEPEPEITVDPPDTFEPGIAVCIGFPPNGTEIGFPVISVLYNTIDDTIILVSDH
ncbi:hypothetical protein WH96_04140 [Kiloniella spongiae]|uniref:RNA polymerase sigma-70 region 2 domain-containing protein n=1 Tax=Kiloniella spongiae TaxID=1489064 RepID=A0A0H2MG92_9PROT|nr:RNA polymerase sigma factor [Kiloniella spongiae]KLN61564.1 hypothetical protein WH96_04140 [Kiloniella spongiae]